MRTPSAIRENKKERELLRPVQIRWIPLWVLTGFVLVNCSPKKQSSINYLNQTPPGMEAALFSPGVISTDAYEHSAPAFSPDGSVVLWTVLDKNYHASMMEMSYQEGKWSAPYRPTFADSTADDYYPSFSPDGKKLYFSSRRKEPAGFPEGLDIRIWEVERNEDGWGHPVPVDTTISKGQEYAHSITANGTLYFSSPRQSHTGFNIRKSKRENNGYTKATILPFNINSLGYEDGPYIAPDESFLIFESDRPGGIDGSLDLYIAFRNKDGDWGVPMNMGPKINTGFGERFARLSPDGKYLFFGSTRAGMFDIYWIDAQIIEVLRNSAATQKTIESSTGDSLLYSLDSGKPDKASRQLKEWTTRHPDDLDALIIYAATLRRLQRYSEAEQLLEGIVPEWKRNVTVTMETALVKMGLNKGDDATKILSPVLTEGDQLRERYKYLAGALLQMGQFEISDSYFKKAMAIHANRFEYYRRASAYALIGEKNKAFENLGYAMKQGFSSGEQIVNDPDFILLKSDVRWNALMSQLK